MQPAVVELCQTNGCQEHFIKTRPHIIIGQRPCIYIYIYVLSTEYHEHYLQDALWLYGILSYVV